MKQILSFVFLIVSLACVVCVSAYAPRWIDDDNTFLKAFISQDLLSILGVILAITLASASQIHLKFNDLEERAGKFFLSNSRKEVKQASYALLFSFVLAVLLVIVKPLFVAHNLGVSFINGFGIWLLFFNILILFDITAGIFSVGPVIRQAQLTNLPASSPQANANVTILTPTTAQSLAPYNPPPE